MNEKWKTASIGDLPSKTLAENATTKKKKNTVMVILLFLDREESYRHTCIITANASMQGLHGFFRCLSHGWVDTVTCLTTAVGTKA